MKKATKWDAEELKALGLYFTVSDAGQLMEGRGGRGGRMTEALSAGDWKRVQGICLGILEEMAMDAGSIGTTPDRFFNSLLREAKEWSGLAKRGNKATAEQWQEVKARAAAGKAAV